MLIVLLAAPLIAAGLGAGRRPRGLGEAMAATGLFAAALWFWHAPGPYDATFTSDIVYWAMHLSVIASAMWLWRVVLDVRRAHAAAALVAGFVASLQMGLLGAVITFAPHALYAPHEFTTAPWGLTPLFDQQLGGIIMWIPGVVVFLAAAAWALHALIGEAPLPTRSRA